MLGNVTGTGWAKVSPIGWMVTTKPGSRVSGSEPGVKPAGTSEIDIVPVNTCPLSSSTVCGGMVSVTPRLVFSTTVVWLGSICLAPPESFFIR